MNNFNKKFGSYLKEKRLDAGLNQSEVARKLGYSSPQYISNFERGLCLPPLKKMKRIISLYDINPQIVFDMMLEAQRKELSKTILGKAN